MIRRINAGNRIRFIPGIGIQVITPRAAAKWWLAGGINPANCLAAYQPKGAASYAASKVNLANPGTYNLTESGGTPGWDAAVGWIFNGTNYRFITGVSLSLSVCSVFGAFSESTFTGTHGLFGSINGERLFYVESLWNQQWQNSANQYNKSGVIASGVCGVAGPKFFENGTKVATGTPTTGTVTCHIGNIRNRTYPWKGNIIAIAIYSTTLSDSEAAALSAAMAAL